MFFQLQPKVNHPSSLYSVFCLYPVQVSVQSQGSERSCICVLEVMYLCVRGHVFVCQRSCICVLGVMYLCVRGGIKCFLFLRLFYCTFELFQLYCHFLVYHSIQLNKRQKQNQKKTIFHIYYISILKNQIHWTQGCVLWCLTSLSTIFQLYRGGQFYW